MAKATKAQAIRFEERIDELEEAAKFKYEANDADGVTHALIQMTAMRDTARMFGHHEQADYATVTIWRTEDLQDGRTDHVPYAQVSVRGAK